MKTLNEFCLKTIRQLEKEVKELEESPPLHFIPQWIRAKRIAYKKKFIQDLKDVII